MSGGHDHDQTLAASLIGFSRIDYTFQSCATVQISNVEVRKQLNMSLLVFKTAVKVSQP